jgi:predicted dehydrogenase
MAVVGVGHLGKEHARILSGLPAVELVGVVDANAEQSAAVAQRCGCQSFTDPKAVWGAVDAAVIAVPTCHHVAVAEEFLRRGTHLLIEKPLAMTPNEADGLVALARQHGAVLQVGHIERFNPAFEALLRRPFQPKFIDCERIGTFTGRSTDIGVVLDLMIHDIDWLLHLVKAPVSHVEALGVSVFGRHEDVVHARLTFANGCIAQLAASRASPQPNRRARLWGPEGFASIDFATRRLTLIQPSDEVRKQGLDPQRLSPAARAALPKELYGNHLQMIDLDCNRGDQLTRELQHFVDCARSGTVPRVSGADGAAAIHVAAWILENVRTHTWDGRLGGPTGPHQMPFPLGPLFQTGEAAAA